MDALGLGNNLFSVDAESAVLGCALLSASAHEMVTTRLRAADFYLEAHRKAWLALAALAARGVTADPLLLEEELRQRGDLEPVGGTVGILRLTETVPTAAHTAWYLQTVADLSARRRLQRAGQQVLTAALDTEQEVGDCLAAAQDAVLAVSVETDHVFHDGETVLRDASLTIAANDSDDGVPTGIKGLDLLLGGLRKQQLSIVAGRPSMGKSSFAIHTLHAATKAGYQTLLFSVEMPREQVGHRMLAMEADVPFWKLHTGRASESECQAVDEAMGRLACTTAFWSVMDQSGLTAEEVRSHSRQYSRTRPLDLVIVDHLSELRHPASQSEHHAYTASVKTLRNLARTPGWRTHVMVLAQLNRAVDRRTPPRPMLSDLRESGSIEEHADVVLALYRPRYYERRQQGLPDDGGGEVELSVLKHRGGPTGTVRCEAELSVGRWWQVADRDDAPPDRRLVREAECV